jgi:hypothetical protein
MDLGKNMFLSLVKVSKENKGEDKEGGEKDKEREREGVYKA